MLQLCTSLISCSDLSHAQEPAPAFQPTTPTDLPLRQSKHSVGGTRSKIYDVTEKFTRACNGKLTDVNDGGAWRGCAAKPPAARDDPSITTSTESDGS